MRIDKQKNRKGQGAGMIWTTIAIVACVVLLIITAVQQVRYNSLSALSEQSKADFGLWMGTSPSPSTVPPLEKEIESKAR